MADEAAAAAGQKRRRTRSGCLNCRRKRKKCDEKRPRCVKCERGNETCEWDSFVKFQPPTGLPPSTTHGLSGPITLQIGSDSEVSRLEDIRIFPFPANFESY
ncbi:hypothetical protein WHR41_09021 [Cladosporium halotolerans]|uniref:Zn(2)-C6 fungal-type domain-containing protein n=1 Tax=Cladosporium halotolerans TaxID=1052096 RepID=A0AB34KAP4_9PEZI